MSSAVSSVVITTGVSSKYSLGPIGLDADDDAVGAKKIFDRRSLSQELGIGNDVELGGAVRPLPDSPCHLPGGANRHRTLLDDDLVPVEERSKLIDRVEHLFEIGAAVGQGRCPDGDEDHVGFGDGFLEIGHEMEPSAPDVARDDMIESRLVDRNLPFLEPVDAPGVDIDAEHVVAEVRQARAGNQAHIAGTDHAYLDHISPPDELR
jgi:hypothetical protein